MKFLTLPENVKRVKSLNFGGQNYSFKSATTEVHLIFCICVRGGRASQLLCHGHLRRGPRATRTHSLFSSSPACGPQLIVQRGSERGRGGGSFRKHGTLTKNRQKQPPPPLSVSPFLFFPLLLTGCIHVFTAALLRISEAPPTPLWQVPRLQPQSPNGWLAAGRSQRSRNGGCIPHCRAGR